MDTAPLYDRISEAPEGGVARWIEASDGVRLRLAIWGDGASDKGTILIFPGRTEFIEKYGRVVRRFRGLGYGVAVIDWRGQGLSDRLSANRQLGHVGAFEDYQRDVAAMLTAVKARDLPGPLYLCAHSMGGTIGLRALHEGLPVKKALFTAPMWGLHIDPLLRPIIQAMAAGTKTVGMGEEFSPGTGPDNYVLINGYKDNALTSDAETFAYLVRQIAINPGLSIGGPSIHWLYEALVETRALSRIAPPAHDTLCMLGSDESVVNKRDIVQMMEHWQGGKLQMVAGARHEIMMETTEIQQAAFRTIDGFFSAG